MYLIRAGEIETEDSAALEQKRRIKDFEQAKAHAIRLLKKHGQVEVIDLRTNECVYFQVSKVVLKNSSKKNQPKKLS